MYNIQLKTFLYKNKNKTIRNLTISLDQPRGSESAVLDVKCIAREIEIFMNEAVSHFSWT